MSNSAPLGLGVILTLCSTGYCIYIHYSKRRLVERIKKEMLAKKINGPDATVDSIHWYTKLRTPKTGPVSYSPKPLGYAVSIGGSQADIYSHPLQSRTDIFVRKVGNEVFSSLVNERSQAPKVPYQDGRYISHYSSAKNKKHTTNLPNYEVMEPEGIYVNCPIKPSQTTRMQIESRKHYNMRYQ